MKTANGSPFQPAVILAGAVSGAMLRLLRVILAGVRLAAFFGWLLICWTLVTGGTTVLFLARAGRQTRLGFGVTVMHWFMRGSCRIFGLEIEEIGERPYPGSLVVSNHRSYLDIAVLGGVVPTSFLAKAEVARWPLIGGGGAAAGVLFVRRGDHESGRRAADEVVAHLEAGLSVTNFPEGTTTQRAQPLPFKSGLFRRVAGKPIVIVPARIDYTDDRVAWVGDASFLPHLFGVATRLSSRVRVTYSQPIDAAQQPDADKLRDACYRAVCQPEPASERLEDRLRWLPRCWRRTASYSILGGRFRVKVFDQPGRWMGVGPLRRLHQDLLAVARESVDEMPGYGPFTGQRSAYANRVIAIAYDIATGEPVAFTAMVYLSVSLDERTSASFLDRQAPPEVVIHLGLTMIRRAFRGQRIQTPLFKKIFLLPMWNLKRLRFTVTNIAASPAGIGAVSDYFFNVYPEYRCQNTCQAFHREVAEQVLSRHRHEFGCSEKAVFEPRTFVVRGSNDPAGGGAYQFIKDDPVSRYRDEECNRYCREGLDYSGGDELFQVGEVDVIRSLWASRASRRRLRQKRKAQPPPELQANS